MAGRPTKLTPELQAEIAELLKKGNFVETVCDYLGLSKNTFYDWVRRGERGWQVDIDAGYVEFSDAIKKAISEVEQSTVEDLREGPLNWQAKAWWLERRHPDKWGNRQKHEVTGKIIIVNWEDDQQGNDSD
jgi:transposase